MTKRASTEKGSTRKPTLCATAEGTNRFADRWRHRFVDDYYRTTRTGLTVSSLALGTYLGESDEETDAQYRATATLALSGGINLFDSAINYRCQRSERVLGEVLQEQMSTGGVRRDEVVLCTKGGYIPLDGAPPQTRAEYEAYLDREYFKPGILKPEEVVGGGHAIAPAFLEDQIKRSLRNFGVQSLDYFYVHNPEQQLSQIAPDQLRKRLHAAFQMLESYASRGIIGAYGCATWTALRLPAGSAGHMSLYELVGIAREIAGDGHHFRVAQLPINLTMSEAVRVSTQRDDRGRLVHVVDAAQELGIDLIASAPLLQGKLTRDLPAQVRDLFGGATDAQRALAFVRVLPSVIAAAVGMRQSEHLVENLTSLKRV